MIRADVFENLLSGATIMHTTLIPHCSVEGCDNTAVHKLCVDLGSAHTAIYHLCEQHLAKAKKLAAKVMRRDEFKNMQKEAFDAKSAEFAKVREEHFKKLGKEDPFKEPENPISKRYEFGY